MSGCAPAALARLVDFGLVPEQGLTRQDVTGIRLLLGLDASGIDLAVAATALRADGTPLDFLRRLTVEPTVLSRHTFGELSRELALRGEDVTRLFVAAGLPVPDPDRRAREDEVALLRIFAMALKSGVSADAAARVLRVFGHAARRASESMRDMFRSEVEDTLRREGLSPSAIMSAAAERRVPLQRMGLDVVRLLHLRYLEEVVFENVGLWFETELAPPERMRPIHKSVPAVAFADIVGFTPMTREMGDEEAATKAAQFEALAQEVIIISHGRIVKSLGDGLLLFFRDAGRAPASCAALIDRVRAAGLPPIRIGLAVGAVLSRDGDIFGTTVNLAARLVGFAEAGQVVADAPSAMAVGLESGHWVPCGRVTPKGMTEVDLVALDRQDIARRAAIVPR